MEERQEQPKQTNGTVFVEQYRARMDALIKACREAASMTDQTAWRLNYQTNQQTHEHNVRGFVARLKAAVDRIEMRGTDEAIEKELKDATKLLAEERERHTAYMDRAVRPFQRSVEQLQSLRDQVLRDARSRQEAEPLLQRGLVEEVQRALGLLEVASWDDEAGTVMVS